MRVVYNPKTMTYRTILNKSKFQVIDKKDLEFYKEAEKTDKSIKVCEVNEEDFLYLNFDTNSEPTEEELMQMLEKARKEMSGLEKEKYNSEVQLTEDSQFNENIVNVPNFGTQKEEWNLSGTIEQCIIRYASKSDGDQMNEILLGLEEGLTDEQVKSYFKLPADQWKKRSPAAYFMSRKDVSIPQRILYNSRNSSVLKSSFGRLVYTTSVFPFGRTKLIIRKEM